ncbi:MAG: polysaccharide pyruvyl transferase family protein [Euryarchaeota archaeon]|nr:polysaccharide pyruvyl transferase family protein [Euryarchaeota archaeon]MBU4606976.1 polysaccharide pyruvyl transferase family protein [Euryarchaeota archaeon]MBV1754808.1 polysaccharide pyruvyl transferase family protein [Methanobacterium sp.]MBV1767796.1 polysaccharide pyruvyl transferase family protein [Methanobacterium sp.]
MFPIEKTESNTPDQYNNKNPRVLLVGYNGANNTGSESRLLSIIQDVQWALGPEVLLTIPTLNEEKLKRYVQEEKNLKIVPLPSIYFLGLRKLVKNHDFVLLIEGSCYMDTWTPALLWAFLWATRCAYKFNKPCLAYAVDAGDLSPLNKFLVKKEASKTSLIITRNYKSAEILKSVGVTAPIKVTADCALNFETPPLNGIIEYSPHQNKGLAGIAVVNFYLWPVVLRPFGKKKDEYKWPYYFSRSKKREMLQKNLARSWAKQADHLVEIHHKNIALICMEDLDEDLACQVLSYMKNKDNACIFSSKDLNASKMTGLLQNLDILITSRYHASILSLSCQVPQIAVGHDRRLEILYEELEMDYDYFFKYNDPDLWEKVENKVDEILENPDIPKKLLESGFKSQYLRSLQNRGLLKSFLKGGK